MNFLKYVLDIDGKSDGNRERGYLRTGALGLIVLVMLLGGSTTQQATLLDQPESHTPTVATSEFQELETRLNRLDLGLQTADAIYRRDIAPIENVLRFYSQNDTLIRRIALALVREAEAERVDARLLTSVLLVENPWLNPSAKSSVGAVGLMQVMPLHKGNWACDGEDLTDPDTNICYGAKVFGNALRRSNGNLDRALLRYNGCVRGTNTPDCKLYPRKVYAAAGRALVQDWLDVDKS